MKNRFAILGGTGTTGIKIAELLLEHTDATVLLLARNRTRIDESVDRFKQKYVTNRILGAVANAGDEESLFNAFKNIDMVIVASGTAELVTTVARAALKANIDYLDIQYSQNKINELRELENEIQSKNKLFITDAGYHPGLPAALVRYSEAKWGNIKSSIIYGAIKQDWRNLNVSIESKVEFVKELANYEPYLFTEKRWKKVSMLSTKEFKSVDFGEPIGTQKCAPMIFEELKNVTEQLPDLSETGFYITGFNIFIDMVLLPIGMVWMKLFKNFGIKSIARLMFWSLEKSSNPPFRTALKLEATDFDNKKHGLQLSHEEGYWLTAIPVVACIIQYINRDFPKTGLYCMGNIVEPVKIINDMKKMGIEIKEY